ncbi:hypothetical protein L249_8519 [Ophiocordyceps polyrhachis-furcata BCC 54312]|uniref:Intradiol ring-cleavage dioxygenases domain-containing protein n=1 Tax=Ophiocordyceps polyrhachis-furcata BCC 54312 TaxID=1330021 RepID=A0A367L718_9HYPO|nr:hypothetical protein L249_8519 [Ophiocordyceps polyrhachis-furcata BCC 54312]
MTQQPNGQKASSRFDPAFTQHVIDTMGPNVTPRSRVVLSSLLRHLHDFAREVELTNDEWMTGVHFVNAIGKMTTPQRNEAHRVSDVLDGDADPTSSSILGPFWSPNAPFRENGSSIMQDPAPGGISCRMYGTISDMSTGKPIPGAVFDIWQASSNGCYDFQDPEHQSENNLRGKFTADENGRYELFCLHPTAYSLPTDGPSFELLQLMDRSPMRPAHIHIKVTHPDFRGLTTQLYPRNDPHLATDTVFAVKDDLVVDFKKPQDAKTEVELEYNVRLTPKGYKGRQF